ncbi:MAG: depolymerase family esterase [Myxococcaceae bacterium]|nr:depolymerase family esterase [Myxococcaceae bacterium]
MTMMKLGLGAVLVGAMVLTTACGDPGSPGTAGTTDGTTPASSGGSTVPGSSGGTTSGGPGSSGGLDGGAGDGSADPAAEAPCTLSAKSYGSMKMWECVPTGMGSAPAGLVVAMHGYTQGVVDPSSPNQAWGFKSTSQWATLAQQHKFYVIFPDKGTSAFSWYAYFGTSGIARTDLEPSQIAAMVTDVTAKYSIDPAKVFVNGLSAGAYMTTVMLATYPDVFAAGSMFEGGAYGCSTSCAALGKKGMGGWTWPGNHAPTLVTGAYPTVWKSATAKKPRLLVFQGDADGAVTPENMADVVQQWKGATGITGAGTTSTLKGHEYTEYTKDGQTQLATILMHGIGHGTPVDPGSGADQGGWDPVPSQTASSDANAKQDWTNSAGIWGPYYSAKFFGLIP